MAAVVSLIEKGNPRTVCRKRSSITKAAAEAEGEGAALAVAVRNRNLAIDAELRFRGWPAAPGRIPALATAVARDRPPAAGPSRR